MGHGTALTDDFFTLILMSHAQFYLNIVSSYYPTLTGIFVLAQLMCPIPISHIIPGPLLLSKQLIVLQYFYSSPDLQDSYPKNVLSCYLQQS
jgi:hypothetical protein